MFQPLHLKLEELKNSSVSIPNITLINENLNRSVTDFSQSGIDAINFSVYYAEVSRCFSAVSSLNFSGYSWRRYAFHHVVLLQRRYL